MEFFHKNKILSNKSYKKINKNDSDNSYRIKNKIKYKKIKYINFTQINVIYCLIISTSILFSFFILYKLIWHRYPSNINTKKYFIPNTYRLAFVFGTRPEAIKLFPLIKELQKNKNFICIIINTGQHKEMIQQILDSLNMENSIDFNLDIMEKNQSLAKITSKIILELDKIYSLINPNALIVQGDTTTGYSAAVSAFYQKIPIFHVEAGLRTNDFYYPFPEEFNRKTIDDISSLYFALLNGLQVIF